MEFYLTILLVSCAFCHDKYVQFITQKTDSVWKDLQQQDRSTNSSSTGINTGGIPKRQQDIPHKSVDIGLSDMASFIYRANLTDLLSSKGPFTVFGPSDLAFFQLPSASRKALFLNNTLLRQLLEYHVIKGKLSTIEFKNDLLIPSLLPGRNIRLNLYKKNSVLTASGAKLTVINRLASNGVIHGLSSVMSIPTQNISQFILSTTGFTTLRRAFNITGLYTLLTGNGPFTMFAPSDAAFVKLAPGEIDSLMKNPRLLKHILLYHVINSTVYTAGLTNGDRLQMMIGQTVQVHIDKGHVKVNTGELTMLDISTTNGAIHVIDSLLIPPEFNLT